MNKYIRATLVLVLFVSMSAAASGIYSPGDVNCDGSITAGDALLVLRKAVGQTVNLCASPYNAIHTSFHEVNSFPNGLYGEITNITFYLPVDAYVYATATGRIMGISSSAQIAIISEPLMPDWDTEFSSDSAFSISTGLKLAAGYHTIYVMGGLEPNTSIYGLVTTVIVSENGSYECDTGCI